MSLETILKDGKIIKEEFSTSKSGHEKVEMIINYGEKFFTIKVEEDWEDEGYMVDIVGRQFDREPETIPLNDDETELLREFGVKRMRMHFDNPREEIRKRWLE